MYDESLSSFARLLTIKRIRADGPSGKFAWEMEWNLIGKLKTLENAFSELLLRQLFKPSQSFPPVDPTQFTTWATPESSKQFHISLDEHRCSSWCYRQHFRHTHHDHEWKRTRKFSSTAWKMPLLRLFLADFIYFKSFHNIFLAPSKSGGPLHTLTLTKGTAVSPLKKSRPKETRPSHTQHVISLNIIILTLRMKKITSQGFFIVFNHLLFFLKLCWNHHWVY